MNKWNFFGAIFLIAVIGVALIGTQPKPPVINPPVSFQEMPRFESEAAMIAAFEKAQAEGRQYGMWDMVKGIAVPMMATSAEGAVGGGGTVDYSTTNIQVEGVDEADIVKSDGKYIYNFSKNRLIITDAYPIENSTILSKTELQNVTPQEMFIAGNKLLLFGYKYEEYEQPSEQKSIAVGEYYPYWGGSKVIARLYDISNRTNPKVLKEIEFEGSYVTSRLIGENAYFVVTSWPRNWVCEDGKEGCIIPLMVEDGVEKKVAEATEIGYIPPMPASSFVTIASLNLETEEMQKETIAGSADSVYASLNSIYLAATAWMPPETPIIGAVERIIT
ncbi:MAG: beta-propeller domain-containing protein, partial [Candidatus Diapherotrites archaeon]|nr:beta-propeller domain-containing protein [Candidatus Diapherotrites archaeon]